MNNGSSIEIQMVIAFHSDVRYRRIIYRDASNWTRKLSANSMGLTHTPESRVMAVWICRGLPCWIWNVLIYYAPELDIRGKSNDHLNFSIVFVFSFSSIAIYRGPHAYTQVQSYGRLSLPRASVFKFEGLDILWARIGHPSEMLWPFEFIESYRFSFLSVSIYHGPDI